MDDSIVKGCKEDTPSSGAIILSSAFAVVVAVVVVLLLCPAYICGMSLKKRSSKVAVCNELMMRGGPIDHVIDGGGIGEHGLNAKKIKGTDDGK